MKPQDWWSTFYHPGNIAGSSGKCDFGHPARPSHAGGPEASQQPHLPWHAKYFKVELLNLLNTVENSSYSFCMSRTWVLQIIQD